MDTQELLAVAAITLAVIAAYSFARDVPDDPFGAGGQQMQQVRQVQPMRIGLPPSRPYLSSAR